MSNYYEYKNAIAFHPGYYIQELIDDSGLTQEDYAKSLGTTPKNLSLLIRGRQSLSIDMAMKLSRMTDTSIDFWLNLQKKYDTLIAEFKSDEELEKEKQVFSYLSYTYFTNNFDLPLLPRKTDDKIKFLRNFLKVSSLTVFKNHDMGVNFRSTKDGMSEKNVVRANIMVQIATNFALKLDAPKFDKKLFDKKLEYALTLTENHEDFYSMLKSSFLESGVIFVVLPNLPGSKINGATKKIGNSILLMVTDRRLYSDTFWFTLFHEAGHIMNSDYGISFESEKGEKEQLADKFAENKLIPADKYKDFVKNNQFDSQSILKFSHNIDRDPGIVLGRLMNDGKVRYDDRNLMFLRKKYKIEVI